MANSVAVSVLSPNKSLDRLEFFWSSSGDGSAEAILRLTEANNAKKLKQGKSVEGLYDPSSSFWPLGGLAAASSLLIVGQFVTTQGVSENSIATAESSKALKFRELVSASVVVSNPLEPPSMWKYQHAIFPEIEQGSLRWFAIAATNGEAVVRGPEESVYLLGSFTPQDEDSDSRFDFFSVSTSRAYQVIARVSAAALLKHDLDDMTVLCSSSSSWLRLDEMNASKSPPKALFAPRISEGSFHFDARLRQWLVASLQLPAVSVQLCRAAAVEGPWTCELVMKVPSPWNDAMKFVTYAAKIHPELQTDETEGDLVLSLVPNAVNGFFALFQDSALDSYSPKFFRLKPRK